MTNAGDKGSDVSDAFVFYIKQIKLLHFLQVTMCACFKEKIRSNQGKNERLVVSLRTLADMLDAHRSSIRRWLQEAGIKPIVLGRGRNGAIRYLWSDIKGWLDSLKRVD